MGLFSSIGGMFNDLTGATASAKLQNKYQKEFAQNAHQWEMKDLQKAGLNPALTATRGGGASAGGAGGTTGSSGINPVDVISSVVGMNNQTKETNAGIDKITAEIRALPQQLENDQMNAFANLISAFASQTTANANAKVTESGVAGKTFGTKAVKKFEERVKQEKEGFQEMFKDGWKSFLKEMKKQAKATFKR